MTRKTCGSCGGVLKYTRSDLYNMYYECPYCGELLMIPIENEGGVNLVFEKTKNDLLSRLRRGFEDWRVTNWSQLYRDFVDFISAHEHLQADLQFQMALVACITKGFNSIDPENYQQSKTLFKVIDKIYKQQLKEMKSKSRNPALSESIADYEASRAKYVQLHNNYVNTKMPWSLIH